MCVGRKDCFVCLRKIEIIWINENEISSVFLTKRNISIYNDLILLNTIKKNFEMSSLLISKFFNREKKNLYNTKKIPFELQRISKDIIFFFSLKDIIFLHKVLRINLRKKFKYLSNVQILLLT